MTNFKGTKGKWSLLLKNMVYAENRRTSICNTNLLDENHEADALLISKAPEMLEMLEELINLHELGHEIGQYDKARELIKSATEL